MTAPKSFMSQYLEGQLVSRHLHDLLNDHAAQARFDLEIQNEQTRPSHTWKDGLVFGSKKNA